MSGCHGGCRCRLGVSPVVLEKGRARRRRERRLPWLGPSPPPDRARPVAGDTDRDTKEAKGEFSKTEFRVNAILIAG